MEAIRPPRGGDRLNSLNLSMTIEVSLLSLTGGGALCRERRDLFQAADSLNEEMLTSRSSQTT